MKKLSSFLLQLKNNVLDVAFLLDANQTNLKSFISWMDHGCARMNNAHDYTALESSVFNPLLAKVNAGELHGESTS